MANHKLWKLKIVEIVSPMIMEVEIYTLMPKVD